MRIPRHWAEAEAEREHAGRRLRIRRYGWSEDSIEGARAMAERRVEEAVDRLRAGESVPRGESKRGYDGADGLPIREEILEEYEGGRVVVTRNSYGARCLNVPDVLIADVDDPPPRRKPLRLALVWMVVIAAAARFAGAPVWLAAVLAAFVLVAESIAQRVVARAAPSEDDGSVERVRFWSRQHSEWGLRIYQTPRGHRVLVTHRLFDCVADAEAIGRFFEALGADPVYARMCATQHCFRARLSPKPWRLPLKERRLRSRGWPLREAQLEERAAWVERYEQASREFAACRHVETLGATHMPSEVARVVELHDRLSGAHSQRPIA